MVMADIFCCCCVGARAPVSFLPSSRSRPCSPPRSAAGQLAPGPSLPAAAPRARGGRRWAAVGTGAGAHLRASEAVGRPFGLGCSGAPALVFCAPLLRGPCVYLETLRQSIKSKVLMECQHRDSIQVARNDGCGWARSAARGTRRARPAAPAAPVAPTAQPPTPGPAPAPTRRSGSSSWSVSIETLFKLQG